MADVFFCVHCLITRERNRFSFPQRCSENFLDGEEDAGQHAKHLLSFLLDSALSSVDTGEVSSV